LRFDHQQLIRLYFVLSSLLLLLASLLVTLHENTDWALSTLLVHHDLPEQVSFFIDAPILLSAFVDFFLLLSTIHYHLSSGQWLLGC
jgi:hypothetical protein